MDVDQHVRYALVLQATLGTILLALYGYVPGGATLAWLAAGLGIALARRTLVEGDLQAGRLVRLFELSVPDPYGHYFVWRADHPQLPALFALRDWLLEQTQGQA